MRNRFLIGEHVKIVSGRYAGQKGLIKTADYGFRFGWTYTVLLPNGERKVFWESDLSVG